MKQIRNATRRPVRVPLAGGKVLHLGPLAAGQVSEDSLERPAFRELVAEGFDAHSPEAQLALGDVLAHLAKTVEPDAAGGALLVGTKATVVIAHGSSSSRAITNAIGLAADGAAHHIPELLAQRLGDR